MDREIAMTTDATNVPALAAIDIGSNTIHLVVARPLATSDGTPGASDLEILVDETALVRLGADVTASGAIGPERTGVALDVLRQQVATARGLGASVVLGVATEGVRAARNGVAFLQRVRQETGIVVALVSGEQEAALTFWGATSGHALVGRGAVVDLGGGSMELVVGDAARIAWRVSLPLGSGALHDRLAPADPADPEQLALVERTVVDTLQALAVPLPVREVAACGGSATTLGALARRALDGAPPADGASAPPASAPPGSAPLPVTLPALDDARLAALIELLQRLPAATIAQRYGIDEQRARLLPAGAVILRATLRRLGADELRVSRRGIREGAILAYLRHGAGWLDAAARG
jgi:exopolyphosphatase/guanosine-5'-triphosphate,3'-diphosphate pyrophosphatase